MDDQQPGGDSQGHWSAEAVCSQLPPPAGQGAHRAGAGRASRAGLCWAALQQPQGSGEQGSPACCLQHLGRLRFWTLLPALFVHFTWNSHQVTLIPDRSPRGLSSATPPSLILICQRCELGSAAGPWQGWGSSGHAGRCKSRSSGLESIGVNWRLKGQNSGKDPGLQGDGFSVSVPGADFR